MTQASSLQTKEHFACAFKILTEVVLDVNVGCRCALKVALGRACARLAQSQTQRLMLSTSVFHAHKASIAEEQSLQETAFQGMFLFEEALNFPVAMTPRAFSRLKRVKVCEVGMTVVSANLLAQVFLRPR